MKLERGGPWIESGGPESDVVVSSRARLARNLAGFPFVNQASGDQCREILRLVKSLDLADSPMQWLDVVELEPPERELLVERHLVSRNFIEADTPRGVLIGDGERLSVMVNEEDHLRMQVLLPGCDLGEAWRKAAEVDRALERNVDLAVHPRWGYLTACPTNVGTAIRFSVMVHLPALRMTNEIERLRRAANALDLAVREARLVEPPLHACDELLRVLAELHALLEGVVGRHLLLALLLHGPRAPHEPPPRLLARRVLVGRVGRLLRGHGVAPLVAPHLVLLPVPVPEVRHGAAGADAGHHQKSSWAA